MNNEVSFNANLTGKQVEKREILKPAAKEIEIGGSVFDEGFTIQTDDEQSIFAKPVEMPKYEANPGNIDNMPIYEIDGDGNVVIDGRKLLPAEGPKRIDIVPFKGIKPEPSDGLVTNDEADAYANGEDAIKETEITEFESDPPQFAVVIDGKVEMFDSKEEAQDAVREDYAKNNPEYAAAREKCEPILEEAKKHIEDEMAKWEEENGYNDLDPNSKEYKKLSIQRLLKQLEVESEYRKEHPSYNAIKREIFEEMFEDYKKECKEPTFPEGSTGRINLDDIKDDISKQILN